MFIARETELKIIRETLIKKSASVLVYGKRKVDKTTLILQALKSSRDVNIMNVCARRLRKILPVLSLRS